jgi:hypothetical protein
LRKRFAIFYGQSSFSLLWSQADPYNQNLSITLSLSSERCWEGKLLTFTLVTNILFSRHSSALEVRQFIARCLPRLKWKTNWIIRLWPQLLNFIIELINTPFAPWHLSDNSRAYLLNIFTWLYWLFFLEENRRDKNIREHSLFWF